MKTILKDKNKLITINTVNEEKSIRQSKKSIELKKNIDKRTNKAKKSSEKISNSYRNILKNRSFIDSCISITDYEEIFD